MSDSDSDSGSQVDKSVSIQPVLTDSSRVKQALKTIYDNLEVAQSRTGAFTLLDCKAVRESKNNLVKVIESEDSVDKDTMDAFRFLSKALDLQQAKGVFSIDGSIMLLEELQLLEKWVNDHKSASQKLEEALLAKKEARKQKHLPK